LAEETDDVVGITEGPRYQWLNGRCLEILKHDKRRPNYVWGVMYGTGLAQALGIRRISVVEFGVAGGNGLVRLQDIAIQVEKMFDVGIDVYGFDTGTGLPKPTDYRDLPNFFSEGFFRMDVEKLRARLNRANLRLGRIENTIAEFIDSKPAQVAFISFDLDLYTSTKAAFALLEADQSLLLPRIYCYFDDILGFSYSEFNGELLAIAEFNAGHKMRKISKINGLTFFLPPSLADHRWAEQFYLAHIFDHESYGHYDVLNPAINLDLVPDSSIPAGKNPGTLKSSNSKHIPTTPA
jgi:hypothetical protein